MDLKVLRHFVVVAEELNITKAAKILLMSQPPLSLQMKRLEEELHTTLFLRGGKSLVLTEEGKYLYRKAKDILALNDKTIDDILLMGKGLSGTISIGFSSGFSSSIIADWISEFSRENPFVRFHIRAEDSDSLMEKMRLGLISLAVITAPYDQVLLNGFPVVEENMVACLPSSHPLAQNGSSKISLHDLAKEKIVTPGRKSSVDTILKWFRSSKGEPEIVCETDSYSTAIALAEKEMGIAIVPLKVINESKSVVFKPIEGNGKTIEFHFVWRKGHPLPTIEENFIDFVKAKYLGETPESR